MSDYDVEAVLARAEQVQRELLDRRERAERTVIRAHDDASLVEVGVNGLGEVVEVAVNSGEVRHIEPIALAGAMLQAARAAQQQARDSLPTQLDPRADR